MITAELLSRVAAAARGNPALADLRQAFPGIHFTVCAADDVNARIRPSLENDEHELYLVSGASGHCLELTSDFGTASGIVIAAKADE